MCVQIPGRPRRVPQAVSMLLRQGWLALVVHRVTFVEKARWREPGVSALEHSHLDRKSQPMHLKCLAASIWHLTFLVRGLFFSPSLCICYWSVQTNVCVFRFSLVGCMFPEVYLFLLSCSVCWHVIVYCHLLWSFVFLCYQLWCLLFHLY